jgi:hypothetical protein
MTVQLVTNPVTSSGSISFSELRTKIKETGSGSVSLSELYRNGTYVPTASTNGAVPTSGTISASKFYGVNVSITANVTNVEENLDPSSASVFSTDYTTAIRKTINVNGSIISQNTNPALNIPSGAGSTIRIQLTSGGIFGHRATSVGAGGGGNGGTGGAGSAGQLALRTLSNIQITGTGASIAGGGGSGGGGGGGGQEGGGGRNKRGFSCDFAGWQYCESCDSGVGGGSDSGGSGGNGGAGQGYSWNGSTLTLNTAGAGAAGFNPGNGGGAGGTGGSGGGWGTAGAAGANGSAGGQGPGGNCQGGGGGSGGGAGGSGGSSGGSIEGYNRVVSIESTAVLAGATSNN